MGLALFRIGTMMPLRQIEGSSPRALLMLASSSSFCRPVPLRWAISSLVMLSGPGAFLPASLAMAASSSSREKGLQQVVRRPSHSPHGLLRNFVRSWRKGRSRLTLGAR